jgi:hypothetical protein
MRMIIKGLLDGCNWILWVIDSAIGDLLHRHCTTRHPVERPWGASVNENFLTDVVNNT